jgi:hypothetical protein
MKTVSFPTSVHLATVFRKERGREGALYKNKIYKIRRPNAAVFIGHSSLLIYKFGLRQE